MEFKKKYQNKHIILKQFKLQYSKLNIDLILFYFNLIIYFKILTSYGILKKIPKLTYNIKYSLNSFINTIFKM